MKRIRVVTTIAIILSNFILVSIGAAISNQAILPLLRARSIDPGIGIVS